MNMKKIYVAPQIDIVTFCETDICAMSFSVSDSEGSNQFSNELVNESVWE